MDFIFTETLTAINRYVIITITIEYIYRERRPSRYGLCMRNRRYLFKRVKEIYARLTVGQNVGSNIR